MTMIACTVSKSGAVISADSWNYSMTEEQRAATAELAAVTSDFEEARASQGHGSTPETKLNGNVLKVYPVPQFSMLMAVTGPMLFAVNWSLALATILASDIDDVHRLAPQMLRQLHRELGGIDGVIVVHAGWSEKKQSGVGYTYASADGFTGDEIAVGQTISPAPDQDGVNYAEVHRLWDAASKGYLIDQLHRAIFTNLQAAWLAGKLAPGTAIGGKLNQVEVTAAGIRITTAPEQSADRAAA